MATNSLGRTGLILSKKSPEILLGVGVVGVVVGTVLACKATLKVTEVTKEAKEILDTINVTRTVSSEEDYSDADAKRDTALVYIKTGVEIAKLYMPAIAVTGFSIALIVGSHNILSKRNTALAAAYKLVDASFKQYRQRVRDEYGENADKELRFGQKEIKVLETNAKGKEKEIVKKVLGTEDIAPYSFVFSEETATQFKRNYDMNLTALRSIQRYANDRLNIRSHIFMNEILDDLGLPRTRAGAVVGWVKGYNPHNPNNDQYVNMGIDDPINEEKEDPRDAMVQPFFLNFNVDGNVYDLI
jgi:hypothetical protein